MFRTNRPNMISSFGNGCESFPPGDTHRQNNKQLKSARFTRQAITVFKSLQRVIAGPTNGKTRFNRRRHARQKTRDLSAYSLERLEPRIALDATGVTQIQRPALQQSHAIYLYAGNPDSTGPMPVQLGKSDVIGSEANCSSISGRHAACVRAVGHTILSSIHRV